MRHGILMLFATGGLLAQPAPSFEVASIRPSVPGGRYGIEYLPGGRFTASGVSVKRLIQEAYGLRLFQISGGPNWINAEPWEIVAKSEGNASEIQVRQMLRTLLADRLHLSVHRETRDLPVYALVVGKNGPKLQEVKDGATAANRGVRIRGIGRLTGTMATSQQLAEGLSDIVLNGSPIVDRPVLDQTGLKGFYHFTLSWVPEAGRFTDASSADQANGSIFTSIQEQLGLRLEAGKSPVEILVIDSVQKATEN